MARPRVILFDVNETLLDLRPVKEGIGKLLGGGPDAARLWFTTMLQYSLNRTAAMNVSSRHGSGRWPVMRHRSSYSAYGSRPGRSPGDLHLNPAVSPAGGGRATGAGPPGRPV